MVGCRAGMSGSVSVFRQQYGVWGQAGQGRPVSFRGAVDTARDRRSDCFGVNWVPVLNHVADSEWADLDWRRRLKAQLSAQEKLFDAL